MCECSGPWITNEQHNLACDGTYSIDDCGYCNGPNICGEGGVMVNSQCICIDGTFDCFEVPTFI